MYAECIEIDSIKYKYDFPVNCPYEECRVIAGLDVEFTYKKLKGRIFINSKSEASNDEIKKHIKTYIEAPDNYNLEHAGVFSFIDRFLRDERLDSKLRQTYRKQYEVLKLDKIRNNYPVSK